MVDGSGWADVLTAQQRLKRSRGKSAPTWGLDLAWGKWPGLDLRPGTRSSAGCRSGHHFPRPHHVVNTICKRMLRVGNETRAGWVDVLGVGSGLVRPADCCPTGLQNKFVSLRHQAPVHFVLHDPPQRRASQRHGVGGNGTEAGRNHQPLCDVATGPLRSKRLCLPLSMGFDEGCIPSRYPGLFSLAHSR